MAWNKVGSLRKSKEGKLYIKVDSDVTLNKDMVLSLQDPRKSLEASVAAGRIDAEKAETMKAKIPEYIRYDVFLVDNKK
jgi:hypothetical protein